MIPPRLKSVLRSFLVTFRIMAETLPDTKMTGEDWVTRWSKGQIGFHRTFVNKGLEKHIDKLVNGRQNIKFFFPMCGKDLSMKWLYDQGHTIVGAEIAEQAIQEFFQESNLAYEATRKENFKVYKTNDGRIRLYCGSIFEFNKSLEGLFDAVWDRGAFLAVNSDERKTYSTVLLSLLAPDARYLLVTLDYDATKYGGPPHYVSVDEIQELYGKACSIEEVDYQDAFEAPKHTKWGLSSLHERIHLLQPKPQ